MEPHHETPYQVIAPFGDSHPTPAFPLGHGGLAVTVKPPAGSGRGWARVAVDGAPAAEGIGSCLVALPEGDHIVEFWDCAPVRSALVTVRPGAVTSLVYSTIDALTAPDSANGLRRTIKGGPAFRTLVQNGLMIGLAVATPLLVTLVAFDAPGGVLLLVMLVFIFGGGIGWTRWMYSRRRRAWREQHP